MINPFDPSAKMQQWSITERKIENRRDANLVIEVRAADSGEPTCQVGVGEDCSSEQQQWVVSHV